MSLFQTLLLVVAALLTRVFFPGKFRQWIILAISVLVIYWLQPALPIRQMDFWFPTATLGLVFICWGLTTDVQAIRDKNNWYAAALTFGMVIILSLTRFISLEGILTASRPPQLLFVIVSLLLIVGVAWFLIVFIQPQKTALIAGIIFILVIFLILKSPTILLAFSIQLRTLLSQPVSLAQKTDLSWLGFSYLSFRLIHTFIDRVHGRLDRLSLGDYMVYTIFFPAFLAGPIDRFQRFKTDLDRCDPINPKQMVQNLFRLCKGLFKKFILADTLAFFALSSFNASLLQSAGWLWVLVIAFSFQLFFDFAGYTDIAIAAGGFLGFSLPENFNKPYLQHNIAKFWNSWHITLTQWFRSYLFNPMARFLQKNKIMPVAIMILITQISTMIVIGLWHGITINFIIWGLWHGLGLFIHNRWSAKFGHRVKSIEGSHHWMKPILQASSIGLTFAFVSIGWVWFIITDIYLAADMILRMFLLR